MKVVVFDFDGVIIPSEGIKQEAYSLMFSEYGEAVPHEEVHAAREQFANARGNRFDIIRSIFERLGRADIDTCVRVYADRFGSIVEKKMNTFEVSPSARSVLERFAKQYALYINSNTPEEPLEAALSRLGIRAHFAGVYGTSVSKPESLRRIMEQEHALPEETVFIGDGEGDLNAALETGTRFIGIATPVNGWGKKIATFDVVESIEQLPTLFDK